MVKRISIILGCLIFLSLNSFEASAKVEVDEDVKVFLSNLDDGINKMNTYRCIMISENWKGEAYEKKVSSLQFKKPNLLRLDVLEGRKKGTSVVLNKEGKIRGRNTWGIKTTLKPTDERLKNIRGYTFLNASLLDKVERIKVHILQRGCKASIALEEWMGKSTYHLHIDHSDIDDTVTDEDTWFDKETLAILKSLKYENGKKASDTTWQDFEINIPLDDSLFDL